LWKRRATPHKMSVPATKIHPITTKLQRSPEKLMRNVHNVYGKIFNNI